MVDLILSSVVPQNGNRREHVVIELKRPTVHINAAGLMQANKYAVAVAKDPRFSKTDVSWEFWIVGDAITDDAQNLIDDDGYLASTKAGANLPIRAVAWAQIIENAKHRLKFVEAQLEIEPSGQSGLDYLKENYASFMPGFEEDESQDELGSHAPISAESAEKGSLA